MTLFTELRLNMNFLVSCSLAVLVFAAFVPAARSQQVAEASLHGTVRDPNGKPIPNVAVRLQRAKSMQILVARTDSQGVYAFAALHEGIYGLRAELEGYAPTVMSGVRFSPKEVRAIDLVLSPAAPSPTNSEPQSTFSMPQFSDSPQFTISGVTDTTALGGHGSDTVIRTRDSLAKEAASLNADAANGNAANPTPDAVVHPQREETERDHARTLLLAHPDDAELHHSLADAEEKLGDNLTAVREYQRAVELKPSEANFFDWGAELLLHHAAEPAGEVFTQGNHLFPTSVRILLGLGAAWFARGSVDEAVQKICEASDLNRRDPIPYMFLGKIVSSDPVPPATAMEALHRFVSSQPANADANYYYARGLWKLRKSGQNAAEIEPLLNKAIELDTTYGAAYLQLGIISAEHGEYRKAIFNYQRAIENQGAGNHSAMTDAGIEDTHYRLAQAYRQTGDQERAKAELALYEKMAKESIAQEERERHEIRQFVYTLRDTTHALAP